MLHLTWKLLSQPDALSALGKLAGSNAMGFRSSYHIGKIAASCRSQMRMAHEKDMEILNKWAKKDKDGKLVPPVGDEYHFEEGDKPKYEAEVAALADTAFSVKAEKIPAVNIPEKLLTGPEIVAIEEILEGVEALVS